MILKITVLVLFIFIFTMLLIKGIDVISLYKTNTGEKLLWFGRVRLINTGTVILYLVLNCQSAVSEVTTSLLIVFSNLLLIQSFVELLAYGLEHKFLSFRMLLHTILKVVPTVMVGTVGIILGVDNIMNLFFGYSP